MINSYIVEFPPRMMSSIGVGPPGLTKGLS